MFEPFSRSVPTAARSDFHSRRWQLTLVATVSSGLMIAAFVLLCLSVALSDFDVPPVPGSQSAILAAGCLPLCWLVLRLAQFAWDFFPGLPRRAFPGKQPQKESGVRAPSHLVPPGRRWDLLPGGDQYVEYRKKRLEGSDPLS